MTEPEGHRHADLLARAAGGDHAAFHQFYVETREFVYRYVRARVRNDDVEDLLADTYVKAFRFADRFEDRGQPAMAWLVTIARNIIAGHYRSQARTPIGNTGDSRLAAEADADLVERSDDAVLLESLATLKPRHRQILDLRFFQEQTVAQCAAELSLTEQGVRALTYRALQAMRSELGDGFLTDGGKSARSFARIGGGEVGR